MSRSFLRPFLPLAVWGIVVSSMTVLSSAHAADTMPFVLRYQTETRRDSGRFHQLLRRESWNPAETAIIVCDVWDSHHCLNAVRRVNEFAPRLNQVLTAARQHGMLVIHSPSDCMPAYAGHPARRRAQETPAASDAPADIATWCSAIPAEELGVYPLDQSDGGEDDDPQEHAAWVAEWTAQGRTPGTPWLRQTPLLTIDEDRDYITDRGDEVWNVLQDRGIRNVILAGVHTNMCVLGRPFGLRRLARAGKNVVLLRDMTDTMYNPARWPYVSHFTGTDLIIDHIERYVCPTIASDQLAAGRTFRFSQDRRPHLAMIVAEDEYETERTLREFAAAQLGHDFRVTMVYGSDRDRNAIPGLEALDDADLALVSVRRRPLPSVDLERVRKFVQAGKPMVGIRTASHAFSVLSAVPALAASDVSDWPSFDAQVWGGNYHGHFENDRQATVWRQPEAAAHPVLQGVGRKPFPAGASLYKTSPLAAGATLLLQGRVDNESAEPVAWTYTRGDQGRSFYTSLGSPADFANPDFVRLLHNGLRWAAGLPIDDSQGLQAASDSSRTAGSWANVAVPGRLPDSAVAQLEAHRPEQRMVWLRCAIRFPREWLQAQPLAIAVSLARDQQATAWLNGTPLLAAAGVDSATMMQIPPSAVIADDTNLLVVRVTGTPAAAALSTAPEVRVDASTVARLAGTWQVRVGSDASWSNMPLPAKFGASSDIVFAPADPLFVAFPVTRPGEFTTGIEGPACDPQGNVLAVNYARQGTVGRVAPDGRGEVFVDLPEGSIGNGIRFASDGSFFVADYTGHNVWRVDSGTREVSLLAHDDRMHQPNDLAIAPDGTLYASDPNWPEGTGQLWRIDRDGTTHRLAQQMGSTNGIEVSPDGRTLYVNESVQRNIWAFRLTPERTLADKRLVRHFDDFGFDGMRCDVDGNLYVTRHGKGTVVKLAPSGEVLQEIPVLGTKPSNLCFGGPDGCTVYVTEVDFTRLVQFRVDRPGAAWARQHRDVHK